MIGYGEHVAFRAQVVDLVILVHTAAVRNFVMVGVFQLK